MEPEPEIRTPDDFDGCHQFIVPGGIGDISWIYSKIKHLKSLTGKDVILTVASKDLQTMYRRAHPFVKMLDVHWGGYLNHKDGWETVSQFIPTEWPDYQKLDPLGQRRPLNLCANNHLEMGKRLEDWLPMLPTEFHYPLNIEKEHLEEAESLCSGHENIIAVYTSNRDKSDQPNGWAMWDLKIWTEFLTRVSKIKPCSFLLIGADYDRDRTEPIAKAMEKHGVIRAIGKPLGVALECLRRSSFCFSYPSGIGVLANVLRVPAVMFVPKYLEGLCESFADQEDLKSKRYKVWPSPNPEEILEWWKSR